MSDESERVRRIRNENENIMPDHNEAVVTISKTDRFKAGLSRIKEGAQHVGHEVKEQVTNPESETRKATSKIGHEAKEQVSNPASETRRAASGLVSGVKKVANSETFKRVSANSVDLVKGNDNGLLGIHAEQRSRSKNSNMSNMFNQENGEGFNPLGGMGGEGRRSKGGNYGFSPLGSGGVKGGFNPLGGIGEGRRTQPRANAKSKSNRSHKETVTIHGKTYSRKVKNKKHRSKQKRKPVQLTWSPF